MPPVPPRSFPPGTFSFHFAVMFLICAASTWVHFWMCFTLARASVMQSRLKWKEFHFEKLESCLWRLLLWFLPAGHFLMHCDAFHHQNNEPPPALPVRSLRKVHPSQKHLSSTFLFFRYFAFLLLSQFCAWGSCRACLVNWELCAIGWCFTVLFVLRWLNWKLQADSVACFSFQFFLFFVLIPVSSSFHINTS